jgi:hypothetical protein
MLAVLVILDPCFASQTFGIAEGTREILEVGALRDARVCPIKGSSNLCDYISGAHYLLLHELPMCNQQTLGI